MAQTKSAFSFGGITQHSFNQSLSWFFLMFAEPLLLISNQLFHILLIGQLIIIMSSQNGLLAQGSKRLQLKMLHLLHPVFYDDVVSWFLG
jgi:hypothetical protein